MCLVTVFHAAEATGLHLFFVCVGREEEPCRIRLGHFFQRLWEEDFAMSFTMEDFKRQYVKEHFAELTPEEQEEVLQSLSPEVRLAGLSVEQIRQYLEQLTRGGATTARKPRRKK
jgi:hypothetical protein